MEPTPSVIDDGVYSAIVTPHDVPRLIVRRISSDPSDESCSFVHFLGVSERLPDTGDLPLDWDLDAVCLLTSCDEQGLWDTCAAASGIEGWMRVTDGDWPTAMSLDLTVTADDQVRFQAEDLGVADAMTFAD